MPPWWHTFTAPIKFLNKQHPPWHINKRNHNHWINLIKAVVQSKLQILKVSSYNNCSCWLLILGISPAPGSSDVLTLLVSSPGFGAWWWHTAGSRLWLLTTSQPAAHCTCTNCAALFNWSWRFMAPVTCPRTAMVNLARRSLSVSMQAKLLDRYPGHMTSSRLPVNGVLRQTWVDWKPWIVQSGDRR